MFNRHLITKYNQPETLVVISLYPKKGEVYSAGVSGIASYTKNLVSQFNRPVIVLTNYTHTQPSVYEEGQSLVVRCFQAFSPRSWFQILKTLRQFSQVKKILIQFDFSLYGDILTSSLMIPFMLLTRLFGFEVNLVSHSVVLDVSKLSGHIGLGKSLVDRMKIKIYNFVFEMFYFMVGIFVKKLIVLEESLVERITRVVPRTKVQAIPHAVDTSLEPIDKKQARQELGLKEDEYVVLFFGFVNWFKGADFFAKTFTGVHKILGKKVRFIIAGGESSTLKKKPYYQRYYKQVVQTVNQSDNLTLTGYVPQEKIQAYFSAVDLVVFPYRYFMCASGVLSLVFAYRKPFIVSNALAKMFSSSDLKYALQVANLNPSEMSFALNAQSCLRRTKKVLENGTKTKLIRLAQQMRETRSFKSSAQLYDQTLFGEDKAKVKNWTRAFAWLPARSTISTKAYQSVNE